MKHYYSPSTRGFYNTDFHIAPPADAVEITQEQYDALFAAQNAGQVIVPDTDGNPIAIDYVPTPEEAADILVGTAILALEASDDVYIRCGKAGVVWPESWQTYCLALRQVVVGTLTTLPTRPAYPAGT